jgi:hypothetical protein
MVKKDFIVLDFLGYPEIPAPIRIELTAWVQDGVWPGDFLVAVLSNDLLATVAFEDQFDSKYMKALCVFIYNHMPVDSWGSPKKLRDWAVQRWEV